VVQGNEVDPRCGIGKQRLLSSQYPGDEIHERLSAEKYWQMIKMTIIRPREVRLQTKTASLGSLLAGITFNRMNALKSTRALAIDPQMNDNVGFVKRRQLFYQLISSKPISS
jgi:hypothetical protein